MTNLETLRQSMIDNNVYAVVNYYAAESTAVVHYFDSDSSDSMKTLHVQLNRGEYLDTYNRFYTNYDYNEYSDDRMTNNLSSVVRDLHRRNNRPFIADRKGRSIIYKMLVKSNGGYREYTDLIEFVRMFYNDSTVMETRYAENDNENTFDFFTVDIPVVRCALTRSDVMQKINHHKKRINCLAWNILRNSKKFTQYEIPVEFMKIRDITYTNDGYLSYVFSLKIEK